MPVRGTRQRSTRDAQTYGRKNRSRSTNGVDSPDMWQRVVWIVLRLWSLVRSFILEMSCEIFEFACSIIWLTAKKMDDQITSWTVEDEPILEQEVDNEEAIPEDLPFKRVKVLILTFEYTDLDLNRETKSVVKAFKALGYKVKPLTISMDDPWMKLRPDLLQFLRWQENTLQIIYYHGHGEMIRQRITRKAQNIALVDGSRHTFRQREDIDKHCLNLFSHNKPDRDGRDDRDYIWDDINTYWEDTDDNNTEKHLARLERFLENKKIAYHTPEASVPWTEISQLVMSAPNDTLIILDCCNAGLAAATSQHLDALDKDGSGSNPYNKELIGACGWGTKTYDHLSGALCDVLKQRLQGTPSPDTTLSDIYTTPMDAIFLDDVTRDDAFQDIGPSDTASLDFEEDGTEEEDDAPDMSTFTLIRAINNRLMRSFGPHAVSPPQAVHYVLQRSRKRKMVLENLRYKHERRKLAH